MFLFEMPLHELYRSYQIGMSLHHLGVLCLVFAVLALIPTLVYAGIQDEKAPKSSWITSIVLAVIAIVSLAASSSHTTRTDLEAAVMYRLETSQSIPAYQKPVIRQKLEVLWARGKK